MTPPPTACLHVVHDVPVVAHATGGGASVVHQHQRCLEAVGLDVTLWSLLGTADARTVQAEDACRVPPAARLHRTGLGPPPTGWRPRIERLLTLDPRRRRIENPRLRVDAVTEFRRLLRDCRPALVWAQHLGPTYVALTQRRVPVVYSHHDWMHRIHALREGGGADAAEIRRTRRREEALVREAAAVVTGSAVEAEELRALGCGRVAYIPVMHDGDVVGRPPVAPSDPRLVHLGGMRTTATRVGLERFLARCWPALAPHRLPLWVVGSLEGADPALRAALARDARCPGFVPSLAEVLRPYDLHLVPWEHATGQRTRVPVAMAHRQVVVAVRDAVRCYPELVDDVNCALVDRLDLLPDAIVALHRDEARRIRLGDAAAATVTTAFSPAVLAPRFRRVVDDVVAAHA